MKILYVITRSDVMGGASVHLLDLASGMIKNGHDVHILVGGSGVFNQKSIEYGVNVTSIQSLVREISLLNDVSAFFAIRKFIKFHKPDIVHLHSSKAGLLGRLACRSLRVPCIFTAHGWAFTEGVSKVKSIFYRYLEKFVGLFSAKIITVSDFDNRLALKYKIAKPDDIITIHNGVKDNNHLVVKNRSKDSVVKIIMVARFEKQKDQFRLVKVMQSLKHLNWQLEFVGDGPRMQSVADYSRELGLDDKIKFSGNCSDVHLRLFSADIFVLLSHWEGLPLTILEAMSFSLPIVASDVGGVSETFDFNSGFLIPSVDDEFLKDSLTKLITSHELRTQMGNVSRSIYIERFTVEKMIDRTELLYKEVIKK